MGEIAIAFLLSVAILYALQFTGKLNLGLGVGSAPLRKSYRSILKKYFKYYQLLNPEKKKEFEKRLKKFLESKRFIGRGVQVTDEMRVLIGASAIQLTLGLPLIMLAHFNRILIYPTDYYSTINKRHHKGEVNPRLKLIVISWKSFLDGYVNLKDGRNLGLHEMAHAVHLENRIGNREFGFLDADILKQWRDHCEVEMARIRSGENTFLRAYGATDPDEFFAVSVENFFERPVEMMEEMPQTYYLLVWLLRQDPIEMYKLNAQSDQA